MKKHILLGTTLLLTLGTAVAGTFMYGQGSSAALDAYSPTSVALDQPSAMMVETWKATASSSDYIAPKAPI
jgi:hypothetical protein